MARARSRSEGERERPVAGPRGSAAGWRRVFARARIAIQTLKERMEVLGGPPTVEASFTMELDDDDPFGGDPQRNFEHGVIAGIALALGAVLGRDVEPWELEHELDSAPAQDLANAREEGC